MWRISRDSGTDTPLFIQWSLQEEQAKDHEVVCRVVDAHLLFTKQKLDLAFFLLFANVFS